MDVSIFDVFSSFFALLFTLQAPDENWLDHLSKNEFETPGANILAYILFIMSYSFLFKTYIKLS